MSHTASSLGATRLAAQLAHARADVRLQHLQHGREVVFPEERDAPHLADEQRELVDEQDEHAPESARSEDGPVADAISGRAVCSRA